MQNSFQRPDDSLSPAYTSTTAWLTLDTFWQPSSPATNLAVTYNSQDSTLGVGQIRVPRGTHFLSIKWGFEQFSCGATEGPVLQKTPSKVLNPILNTTCPWFSFSPWPSLCTRVYAWCVCATRACKISVSTRSWYPPPRSTSLDCQQPFFLAGWPFHPPHPPIPCITARGPYSLSCLSTMGHRLLSLSALFLTQRARKWG